MCVLKNVNSFFLLIAVSLTLFLLSGCRKSETFNQENTIKISPKEAFYKGIENLDPALLKMIESFQKQKGFEQNLSEFIQKNGLPVWGHTLYKIKNRKGLGSSYSQRIRTNSISVKKSSSNDQEQGLYYVPLQSQETGEIKSYITVYQHNDSLFTYRLFNKDSLNRIRPSNDSAVVNLRNTQAIFGAFEKNINGKNSINITSPEKAQIKNASISFIESQEPTSLRNSNSIETQSTCTMAFYVEVSYEVFILGEDFIYYEAGVVAMVLIVEFDCGGGGGGGGGDTCGCGSTSGINGGIDPGSGTGNISNNWWWQYGTGWPWNNYNYDPGSQWQYWWTSGTYSPYYENRDSYDNTFSGDDDNNELGGYDNTSYTDFDQATQQWPTIANVIPVTDFVGWGAQGITPPNCMSYAKAQIAKKGFKISNYNDPGQTIQIYTAANGVNNNASKNGVGYLLSALQRGMPVIVGVDDQNGSSNPLTDNTTDHFIVIVGSGSDSNGMYFTFYDNAAGDPVKGAHPSNKLYYDPSTGLIKGRSQTNYASQLRDYIVTMIRKSK